MTSISYEEIFNDFLGNITDYTLANLDKSDAFGLMSEYLHKTLSQSYVRSLFSTSSLNDNVQTFSYEMEFVVEENADNDFVRNVLSKGMVIEWLKPQVRSRVNVAQAFMGKEQKFYSQSAHITELRGMLEDTELEMRKMIRDRDFIHNPYLED